MNYDPIDISLERTSATASEVMPGRRPVRPYFAPRTKPTAPPEAFDEVFAALAHKPIAAPTTAATVPVAKPSLNTAPLLALSANLARQHERLAALWHELDSGIPVRRSPTSI